MAFHPFKHFRKHQRKYLVVVTIFTMVIFVASFGAGDLFSSLQRWVALSVPHGDKVLSLYGKSIRTDELERLRWQRQLASEFIFYNAGNATENPLNKSVDEYQKKFSPKKGSNDLQSPVEAAFQQMMRARNEARVPLAANEPAERRLQPLRSAMASIQSQLAKVEARNSEEYRAFDAIVTVLSLEAWSFDPQRRANDSYFGGSLRSEDLLDFLIWKHQADQLGIVLTPADVCRQVNRAWGSSQEFLAPDGKFEANEFVRAFFQFNSRIHKQLTARELLSALTEEFRVLMAKEALLGVASGVRGYRQAEDGLHLSPSVATPDEFYKFFQEQRTALSVSLLPIAVDKFVAEAEKKAQPKEADLRNLYERYKNDEPSPERRQPGFKEPRRVQVEYFRVQPEGPFARKLAGKAIELLPLLRFSQPPLTLAAGGGPAFAVSISNIAGFADLDTILRSSYEKYRDEAKRSGWTHELPDARNVELRASAAAAGELLGSLSTGATPLSVPTCWLGTNALYARNAMTAYSSTVLAAASSSPLPALTLPLSLYAPPTLDGAREQLIERLQNTLAQNLAEKNLAAFRKDLEKELAGHSKEKRAELLKKAAAEYGIEKVHTMKEAQTRQEILDRPDSSLQELRQAYEGAQENPFEPPFAALFGSREPRPDFVSALFQPAELTGFERNLVARGMRIDRPLRSWQFHSPSGDAIWVFWRSEDKPAHVQRFDVVRNEVKQAWYREQARKLAREKAQQINAELKEKPLAPDAAVQILVQQDLGAVFQLHKVSHLTAPEFNLPGKPFSGVDYLRYVPPQEFVPYPPSDFVDQLLKLKTRGDSLVMTDKPVKTFYVAVLMEDPQPPKRDEFYGVYRKSSLGSLGLLPSQVEPLWYQLMTDRQRDYERKLLEQLRAEATKDLQDGDYVLPESVRNRGESSRDFGE